MNTIIHYIAATLALFLGIMSVVAGTKVLLGIDLKEYNILTWLVYYNVVIGFISVITAYFIWKIKEQRTYAVFFILSMHFVVFIYLKFISSSVASESIKAMIFRTIIWILIAVLTVVIPYYINKRKRNNL